MKKIVCLALLLFARTAWAGEFDRDIHSLVIHGDIYTAACSQTMKTQLRQSIASRKREKAPDDLWRLVYGMLCSDEKKDEHFVLSRMPESITEVNEDSGQEPSREDLRSRKEKLSLMARAGAWNPELEFSSNRAEVRLFFWINEACVSELDFVWKKGRWYIGGAGTSCN
ncbi:MAG: hypothetical protein P4L42_14720 [Desulfocapsaceae bacterium]|nr:hypothetical protein [Desulfocapsaceae bacterium]